jgi:uncharacterized protein (TIGR02145 family)
LSTQAEWDALGAYLGGQPVAGQKLKSTSGWASNTGTDDYYFTALGGGLTDGMGNFGGLTAEGDFWFSDSPSGVMMLFFSNALQPAGWPPGYGVSVRCVED